MNNWVKFFAKHPIQTQMLTIPAGWVGTFLFTAPILIQYYEEPGDGGMGGLLAIVLAGNTALTLGSVIGVVGGLRLSWQSKKAYQIYRLQKRQRLINDIKKIKSV